MTSRRGSSGTSAVILAAPSSYAAASSYFTEIEARLAHRDLKNISKEDLPTPCMIVDQEIFEANIQKMADHCRNTGIHLRGHVKVHKSPDIAKRQLEQGAIGLTCATIAECELMSDAGIGGILLTRQVTSRNNIARVIALAKRDPTFATVVDDPLAAEWHQEAAEAEDVKLRTVVDVFAGLTRHGIEAGKPALDLAKKVDTSKNLQLAGLMGYAGMAAHTEGWNQRFERSRQDTGGLLETVAAARAAGLPVEIVTGGSTGTYNIDTEIKGLTELQAGSFVFMDTLYRVVGGKDNPTAYTDFGMSLTVMTTVISKRHPRMCTIDAGNKALLRPTDQVKGRPAVQVQNQGAEYGILAWKDDDPGFELGERVELYPSNLDMSTNVYDRYYVTRGDQVVDVWPIMGRAGAAQR